MFNLQLHAICSIFVPKLSKIETIMKKYIVSLVVLVSMMCAVTMNAQFRYGPMASVDFTDLKFRQDIVTIDPKMGTTVGIMGEKMFEGIGFGIDLGAFYSMKGATINLGEKKIWASEGYGAERCYLHYIQIPLNLRFKYTRLSGFEDYFAPFVFVGPSISILAAKSDIKALEYPFGEIGISMGGGLEVLRHWQVSYFYNWGMTYALKTQKLKDYSAKNRTWGIRVAYLF